MLSLHPPGGKGCVGSKPAAGWERAPQVVAKRNARERTRVHTVNQCHLPGLKNHNKRVSKLKLLKAAIQHINFLLAQLKDYEHPKPIRISHHSTKRISQIQQPQLLRSEPTHPAVSHHPSTMGLFDYNPCFTTYVAPQMQHSAFNHIDPHGITPYNLTVPLVSGDINQPRYEHQTIKYDDKTEFLLLQR